MASLVNYSRNNNAVKSKIMAAGGVRAAIQHLSSKNLDLARHSCALVEVCSKSEEKRRTIGSLGAPSAGEGSAAAATPAHAGCRLSQVASLSWSASHSGTRTRRTFAPFPCWCKPCPRSGSWQGNPGWLPSPSAAAHCLSFNALQLPGDGGVSA